jgi:hypothetical protein
MILSHIQSLKWGPYSLSAIVAQPKTGRGSPVITRRKFLPLSLAALALGAALATLTAPGFAQRSEYPTSAAREAAIRECNRRAEKFRTYQRLMYQLYAYRSCMFEHGEPE